MAGGSETKESPRKKLINTNLISLKCLLFVFFGGMGSLYPFLPLHMKLIGLSDEEIQIISMVSPVVAILGPLVAAPIADKLSNRQGTNEKLSTGRHIRVMIAIACFMSGILYLALLFVPPIDRVNLPRDRRPAVKFSCDQNGASVQQEKCTDSSICQRWFDNQRSGDFLLENCAYVCNPITPKKRSSTSVDNSNFNVEIPEYSGVDGSGDIAVRPLDDDGADSKKFRRYVPESEPPHLCYSNSSQRMCHVYTPFTESLPIKCTLEEALNFNEEQKSCVYPVSEYFFCRIPESLQTTMLEFNQTCSVECDLMNPYLIPGSLLTEGRCYIKGDPMVTFYSYLTIRSIADAFTTSVIALIDAAAVIATRETSCGRGDVGRQLAFGSLGFAAFGSLSGYLTTLLPPNPMWYVPIGLFALLMVFATWIALLASGMPLGPSECWWHTRSGMLALPMSAVKRYGSETAALMIVFVVLGTFWSAMNTYLPIHLKDLNNDELVIGIAMTAGAIPAFIFLWKSEHFVDYFGHSNLLILAFTVYIVRFVGMSVVPNPWWALLSELLQLFTLGIMWITAILYLRHLVPRHMTVTAQALPVIAHFCIGRCLGAVVGAYVIIGDGNNIHSTRFMYQCMAMAAAAIAILYFILYHGVLKPRCHAQTIQGPRQPPTIVQAINGNGNYTPLRVYHNGMGKKGQFRY